MQKENYRRTPRLTRVVIYPKDIVLITGKGERNARDLHKRIRRKLGKVEHQALSIKEFCQYMGLEVDEVLELLY